LFKPHVPWQVVTKQPQHEIRGEHSAKHGVTVLVVADCVFPDYKKNTAGKEVTPKFKTTLTSSANGKCAFPSQFIYKSAKCPRRRHRGTPFPPLVDKSQVAKVCNMQRARQPITAWANLRQN
jgi:hypothetical protein